MNPYELLDIDQDATDDEIKKAYRKISKDCHPDLHGEEARPLFENLKKARDILLDPDQRSQYDEFGTISESKIEKQKQDKDRAISTIINVVNKFAQRIALNGFNGEDLKGSILESIRSSISEGKNQINVQNLNIKRLSNFITRLKSKEGILNVVIETQKNNLKTIINLRKRNRDTVRAMNLAIDLLNDLEFDNSMEEFLQLSNSGVSFYFRG